MTTKQLTDYGLYEVLTPNPGSNRFISKPFCCDLLSIALAKAEENCVWITVMGNINTVAISVLKDVSCIVLAENATLDDNAKAKAREEGLLILRSHKPIFETALEIWEKLNG